MYSRISFVSFIKVQITDRFKWAFCLSILLLLIFNLVVPSVSVAQSEESGYQDYLNFYKDFLLKLHAESLEKSKDPEETQQAFVKLYEKYLTGRTNQLSHHDWEKLSRDAEKFLKLKPTEPFSQVVARSIIVKARKTHAVFENCKKLGDASSKLKKYSLEARLYAAAAVHESIAEADYRRKGPTRKIYNHHLDLLFEWMSQSKDPPEYLQRLMLEEGELYIDRDCVQLIDMLPTFKKKLDAAKDKLSPWLYNMLLATWHLKMGYNARGNGYATTVTAEGWATLRKETKLAAEKAKFAYKLNPERPNSAKLMINIAMCSETDEDERIWFDRAVKAEFDYLPAYDSYRYSLEPKWGGSQDALVNFAIECADTERYDTAIPLMWQSCLVALLSDTERDAGKDPLQLQATDHLQQYDILSQISEVGDRYQAALRQQSAYTTFDTRYYRALGFHAAVKLRQFEEAFQIYRKYHGDVIHPTLRLELATSNKVALAHIIAANGAAAKEVKYIDEHTHAFAGMKRTGKECKELLKKIEEARDKNDLPEGDLYFEIKRKLLRKEVEFHRGKWVNLKFTPDLRYWSNFGGRYEVENPKSLLGLGSSQQSQYLGYNTTFPTPYEVEVTVEGLSSFHWHPNVTAGIVCGRMQGPETGRFFWADTLDNVAGCSAPPGPGTTGYRINKSDSIRLKIKVFKNYYEMFDSAEYRGRETFLHDKSKFVPGRLGLAVTPWHTFAGTVRYSDFRVRKLNYLQPPSSDDVEKRIAYYKKRLETKKSYGSYMALGRDYLELEQYEDALVAYKAAGTLFPESPRPDRQVGFMYHFLDRDAESAQAFEAGLKKSVGNAFEYRRPDFMEQLIWRYAAGADPALRDADKAMKYATALLKTKKKRNPLTWRQLAAIAAAYAEAGDFKKAVKTSKDAIRRGKNGTEKELKWQQKLLKLYQDGKPFHEED